MKSHTTHPGTATFAYENLSEETVEGGKINLGGRFRPEKNQQSGTRSRGKRRNLQKHMGSEPEIVSAWFFKRDSEKGTQQHGR